MKACSPTLLLALLLLVSAGAAAEAAPRPAPPSDGAPQLISRGARWRNVEELRRFAEQGDTLACLELGERCLHGDGVAKDEAAARTWFGRAADGGSGDALFRMGKLLHDGIGGPRDYAQAIAYYLRAAQTGIPEAQHNLGAMFVSARGVRRDYVEGLAWLIVAGRNGAVSDAEQRTRERLAKRPADIARAEERAKELLAALKAGAEIVLPTAVALPRETKPAPVRAPVREAPPKIEIERPRLEVPKPEFPATPSPRH